MQKPSVIEKIEYHSTLDVAALKNKIVWSANEYQRNLELGREIKQIVQELDAPKACLDKENMEALELFENHGQVKEIEQIVQELNAPTESLDNEKLDALEQYENHEPWWMDY